jgi:hypothetical protein
MPMSPGQILEKHFAPGGGSASMSSPSYYSGMTQTDHLSTISHSTAGVIGGSNLPPLPEQSPYQHLQQQQQQSHSPHSPHSPQAPIRPDSPPLGSARDTSPGAPPAAHSPHPQSPSPTPGRHIESGVSNLSDRDRAHLRQISDTTISSVNSGAQHQQQQGDPSIGHVMSPSPAAYVTPHSAAAAVSPPGTGAEAQDYMSARSLPTGVAAPNNGSGSPLRRSIFRESKEDMGVDRDDEDGPGIAR